MAPDTAACNCDASGDPPTGHRPWCGSEPTTAACGCFPHRPDEPCTCDGCWACEGHVIGCTCDINWDCEHRRPA